jgi:hypothetical protein
MEPCLSCATAAAPARVQASAKPRQALGDLTGAGHLGECGPRPPGSSARHTFGRALGTWDWRVGPGDVAAPGDARSSAWTTRSIVDEYRLATSHSPRWRRALSGAAAILSFLPCTRLFDARRPNVVLRMRRCKTVWRPLRKNEHDTDGNEPRDSRAADRSARDVSASRSGPAASPCVHSARADHELKLTFQDAGRPLREEPPALAPWRLRRQP